MTRSFGTFQQIGTRSHQCDATAARFTSTGEQIFVLLDGIGSNDEVQRWTRRQAMRLAAGCARLSWPQEALRRQRVDNVHEYGEPSEWGWDEPPSAVAVAAQFADGQLEVTWCGDARAYLLVDGKLTRLTSDHNARQAAINEGREPHWSDRNFVHSHLVHTTGEIGSVQLDVKRGRLLLASDGLYEPIEDKGLDLAADLALFDDPRQAAEHLVLTAIAAGAERKDNATCLVADLVSTWAPHLHDTNAV
jgi:serine/threonine protein phosphatase PrpC